MKMAFLNNLFIFYIFGEDLSSVPEVLHSSNVFTFACYYILLSKNFVVKIIRVMENRKQFENCNFR